MGYEVTLNLPDHVLSHLQAQAAETHESIETILETTIGNLYPRVSVDPRRAQMLQEGAAFKAMHPDLVKHYLGKFVAVKDGVVVDYDTDLETVALRIGRQFPNEVVYIDQVKSTLPAPLRIRSYNFVKKSATMPVQRTFSTISCITYLRS